MALNVDIAKHYKSGAGSVGTTDSRYLPVYDHELFCLPMSSKVNKEKLDTQSSSETQTDKNNKDNNNFITTGKEEGDNNDTSTTLQKTSNKLDLLLASPPKTSSSSSKLTCSKCGAQTLKNHMSRHMLTHSATKPFTCDFCTSSFTRKDNLKEHLNKQHVSNEFAIDNNALPKLPAPSKANEEETLKNKYCHDGTSPKFESTNPLKTTSSSKTSQSRSRMTCAECGTDTLKQHMARHMLIHSGIKPFACVHCTSTFARKDKLKEHMNKHGFYDKANLLTPSKVTCIECGTQTLRKHMARHRLTHSDTKPFACDFCASTFTRKDLLKRHMRKHEYDSFNKIPVRSEDENCKKCDFKTQDRLLLEEHQKTHLSETVNRI